MILNEFKAWFAGITATMGSQPTIEQWDLIKKEIANIGVEKAAPAKQGPFVAQDKIPNPGLDAIRSFEKQIEEERKRRETEDKKKEGIDGFPKGWPSKHYDAKPGWPFDFPDQKYTLGDMLFKGGPSTSDTPEDSTTIVFMHPRFLK